MNQGTIIKVVGPVVDVEFPSGLLPNINNALHISSDEQPEDKKTGHDFKVVLEVAEHLGGNIVRAIAMSSTDGLMRGMVVTDQESPITVPVGDATLGRLMNVVGDPIDEAGEVPSENTLAHSPERTDLRPAKPVQRNFGNRH